MRVLPLSSVKAKLSELVDDAIRTHEHVTITRNGTPAAVIVSADEWDALHETLFWQSQTGIADDIRTARAEQLHGDTHDEATVRARYAR